jgi:hypothetical protein
MIAAGAWPSGWKAKKAVENAQSGGSHIGQDIRDRFRAGGCRPSASVDLTHNPQEIGGGTMSSLTEEEKKKIMEGPPKGTLALMLVFGALFALAWLTMYFGRFLPHGAVS